MNKAFATITHAGIELPVAAALDRHGRPIPLIGDTEPGMCDHKGTTWSDCLDLRCPRCGAPMFLPPRFLAYKPEELIASMFSLWQAAGHPPWHGRSVDHPNGSWGIVPRFWRIVQVQGFDDLGGLPVRRATWEAFEAVRAEFDL
jgi:hypothetical protein